MAFQVKKSKSIVLINQAWHGHLKENFGLTLDSSEIIMRFFVIRTIFKLCSFYVLKMRNIINTYVHKVAAKVEFFMNDLPKFKFIYRTRSNRSRGFYFSL